MALGVDMWPAAWPCRAFHQAVPFSRSFALVLLVGKFSDASRLKAFLNSSPQPVFSYVKTSAGTAQEEGHRPGCLAGAPMASLQDSWPSVRGANAMW